MNTLSVASRFRRRSIRFESMETRCLLASVGGELPAGETVWTAGEGPYEIVDDLTVPTGATLRIEPGVVVHVQPRLEVVVRGSLVALGTPDQRISFTSPPDAAVVPDRPRGVVGLPDGPPRWEGIHFRGTRSADNRLSHVDVHFAQSDNGSIGVLNSNAILDSVSFSGTHLRMVYGSNASLVVKNSNFPDMFPGDERPAVLGLDNVSEHIKIVGRPPVDGQLVIQGNTFGTNKGHNDVIDADSGQRPGPILQILDNVFHGAGDELLDLGGDVFVAGNRFQNVTKDPDNRDRRFANAMSTGDGASDATIVVTRNVFDSVDHTMHLRAGNAAIFEHNTVYDIHPAGNGLGAAIAMFADVGAEVPGRGAYVWGNVFAETPAVFGAADQPEPFSSGLGFDYNLITPELGMSVVGNRAGDLASLGANNVVAAVEFVDAPGGDFRLADGSAGIAANPFGRNLGSDVAAEAWIAGEPSSRTTSPNASLIIGGPGMFAYRFRINGGPWSDPRSIGAGFEGEATQRIDHLDLTELVPDDYQVEVIGQDYAGNWQQTPSISRAWRVVDISPSDLDGNGILDTHDLDLLCAAISAGDQDARFDMNEDNHVSSEDVDWVLGELLGSTPGDVDLNGRFESADLVQIFQAGKYNVGPASVATWAEGDWNCDGRFDSSDLVYAFQNGVYT